jgi:fluoride exporter
MRELRPLYLRPFCILLVVGGGVMGTLARYGVGLVIPAPGAWPLATLLTNLGGAFFLGLLLKVLMRRGADVGGRRSVRLLVGTGFLGAFTTYSTLALDATALIANGWTYSAVVYMALSLFGGLFTGWAGIWIGTGRGGRMQSGGTGSSGPDAA